MKCQIFRQTKPVTHFGVSGGIVRNTGVPIETIQRATGGKIETRSISAANTAPHSMTGGGGGKSRQVAVVRTALAIYAIGNFDPFSKAFVLSRGIVGDRGGVPKIASPIYKQSFDLRTGQCLDDPKVRVPTYEVRVERGRILVHCLPRAGGPLGT